MKLLGVGVLGSVLLVSGRQAFGQSAHEVALSADKLELHNVKAQAATYQGRAAVRVTDAWMMQGGWRLFPGRHFRMARSN
jgi:hypothetical protein